MTDRIRDSFETFAKAQGFRDFRHHFNRYGSPVIRHMWAAWQEQAGRITDMAAALNRAQARNAELVNQCRDHDARRTAAMAQAASLAEEVERLNARCDELLVSCRRAVTAIAHAAEKDATYQAAYEDLSAVIAKTGE